MFSCKTLDKTNEIKKDNIFFNNINDDMLKYVSIDDYISNKIKFKNIEVGDCILFGNYEQDNIKENGKEKLEWIVIEKKENKILLLTKYGIDNLSFNKRYVKTSWENSSIRHWLNNTFLNENFSDYEKQLIINTQNENLGNNKFEIEKENDTYDKIFLLSIGEVKQYLNEKNYASCEPTEWAISRNIWIPKNSDIKYCVWWLRSPGKSSAYASMMFPSGKIDIVGDPVYMTGNAIRPAMWIDIN